jgi:hypothetical protein
MQLVIGKIIIKQKKMKNVKTILPSVPSIELTMPQIKFVSSKSNLINSIYYDTEWWNKKFALEWWTRNGHFNEELYRNILLAKLDSINELQQQNK